ncbi:hypothetical protein JCM33374_g655 [Metschnikowia sp. JCM 33374]|nr:hypothetical protein JCM33374_g655 [Metschnikowia sp. JCM 33374]
MFKVVMFSEKLHMSLAKILELQHSFAKRDDVLYDPSRKADYMLERLFLDVMHDVDFAKNEIAVEAFLKSVVGISDRFAEASALADKVGGSQAKVLEDKRSLVGNVLNMMYEVSVALPQWKGKDGSDKCLRELYQVRPMAYTFVNTEGVPQKDREGFDEFAKQKLAQLEDTKYRLRGYNLKPGEEKNILSKSQGPWCFCII